MKLPRDLSGRDLAEAPARLGYTQSRQTASHIRLTTRTATEHDVTIPDHAPLKPGTPNGILRAVAEHARLERAELLRRLFA